MVPLRSLWGLESKADQQDQARTRAQHFPTYQGLKAGFFPTAYYLSKDPLLFSSGFFFFKEQGSNLCKLTS